MATAYDKKYYDARGLVRYSLILAKEAQAKLIAKTEEFDLSQADVLETLLENSDHPDMAAALKAKAESKKTRGGERNEVAAMLKDMSPEELAKARELLASIKTA